MTKTAADVRGFEHDWLACDPMGHVGMFATAGGSYAPVGYLRATELYGRAFQELLALPEQTEVLSAPLLKPGLTNTWRDLALRGLFGFDGAFNGGAYQRVSVPRRPVLVSELPASLGRVVRRITLPQACFAVDQPITEESLIGMDAALGAVPG